MATNGDHASSKPPPSPSPLRNAKFFQANMRILVTGGAGFIGSHLVDKLMENEKNEVIVADNYFTGSKDNLKKWIGHPRFELIRHDVTEPLLVEVDQIFHLACPASPIFYKHNPVKTIKTNVIGTLNMLGLAKRVGARILLTSTSEVYGDPLIHPQVESYWGNVNPIGVRSCYDEGKRVAETLMFDYHRQHGIEIRIARIFNTYGPRMNIDDGRVVSNFIAQAIRNDPLTVQSPGTQTRSFCYVSDMETTLVQSTLEIQVNLQCLNSQRMSRSLSILRWRLKWLKTHLMILARGSLTSQKQRSYWDGNQRSSCVTVCPLWRMISVQDLVFPEIDEECSIEIEGDGGAIL
ncbi:PREDICTED: UDP-glucuronic acid decarboxylase 1-like [Fragaria vesca subsp. vesca]